ncbi:arsenate reductase ArsC [Gallaecimonas mangrovi]|uniref:arsenate reductase ArsC n=1 Tax=Gallaecimonas mangrovi TaxID=2291597 RepID=UPI000E200EBA|nr:arsenate reductase ArsC [Gallaecimonas mangrovi]
MKLLFVCTHNRCRSILAEAVTRHFAKGQLEVRSAGSQPAGAVHPLSIKYLQEAGIDTRGLCSQSWDELEAFAPDVVITVCDSAAGESCPLWFGNAIKVHWGLKDPSALESGEREVAQAFRHTIALLERRIKKLLAAMPLKDEELQHYMEVLADE